MAFQTRTAYLLRGEMRELLPQRAVVDGMLGELDVVRADAFSLSPFVAEDGSVDFDPVPMIHSHHVSENLGGGDGVQSGPFSSLSPADLDEFQKSFRRRSTVVQSTPLKSRTVLVLSPKAHKVFQKARAIQRDGTRDEKRTFVAPALRGAAGELAGVRRCRH